MNNLSAESLSEAVARYSSLGVVLSQFENWTNELRLQRDDTGEIYSATCSMESIPIRIKYEQLGRVVAHVREAVPTAWRVKLAFEDIWINKTSDFESLDKLAQEHDFTVTGITLCASENTPDLRQWIEKAAERSYVGKVRIWGLVLDGAAGNARGMSVQDAVDALDSTSVLAAAGIKLGRLNSLLDSPVDAFNFLLSRPDVMRDWHLVYTTFDLPSPADGIALQQLNIPPWTDPPIRTQELAHLHFALVDKYPASENVTARFRRLGSGIGFLDRLADLCLYLCGPNGDYSIKLWGEPDGEEQETSAQADTTEHIDMEYNIYLQDQLNRRVQLYRKAAEPGWRRIFKA